jgi:hypothetical protein
VDDWVDATVNRPLTTGDRLWVSDNGRVEMHVGSTVFRLKENTAFQLMNLDDNTAQLSLTEGSVNVKLRRVSDNQTYEVDTPNVAVTLLGPGNFRVDTNPDNQSTTITIWGGHAEVTGGGQAFTMRAGQQAVVNGDQQINYNVYETPGHDSWDTWGYVRDQHEDHIVAEQYVSPDVTGYEDLDGYGRWSNSGDYGQVWYPNNMPAGWAPYHDGHWAWVAPWGWTWVDDAPWGFAPYHYGRWASIGGAWGWVPGPIAVRPVYAPALVAWVGGGGGGAGFSFGFSGGMAAAVAWFPLGPREPFFPSYRVSPGYFNNVNVSNTVINKTVINNYYTTTYVNTNNTRNITNITYANQRVNGAVMAVPQNNFGSGRPVQQVARVVPEAQLRNIPIAVAPAVVPQRAAVLGLHAASVGSAPRPPAALMNRPVVAKIAPPPPPVSFVRQQAQLTQNPGRPVAASAMQQMRQASPPPAPAVRVAPPAQARPAQISARPVPGQPPVAPNAPGRPPAMNQAPANPNTPNRPPAMSQPPQAPRPQTPAVTSPVAPKPAPVTTPARPAFEPPQRPTPQQAAPVTPPARPVPARPSFEPPQKPAPPDRPAQATPRPNVDRPPQPPARPNVDRPTPPPTRETPPPKAREDRPKPNEDKPKKEEKPPKNN